MSKSELCLFDLAPAASLAASDFTLSERRLPCLSPGRLLTWARPSLANELPSNPRITGCFAGLRR